MLNDSVSNAIAKGVVFAVAAGNSNADAANTSPASCEAAITVAAAADDDGQPSSDGNHETFYPAGGTATEFDDAVASFSNYGDVVDIIAPVSISSPPVRGGGYNTISGTFMATPHVTGVAAALSIAARGGNDRVTTGADVAAVRDTLVNLGIPHDGSDGYIKDADPTC